MLKDALELPGEREREKREREGKNFMVEYFKSNFFANTFAFKSVK